MIALFKGSNKLLNSFSNIFINQPFPKAYLEEFIDLVAMVTKVKQTAAKLCFKSGKCE